MNQTNNDSLTHYGVLGMKWGKRKQRVSNSSGTKKSRKSKSSSKKSSSIKKKIQNITSKVDKEKVKSIAKATAKVAGTVAVTSLLGYTGAVAISEINSLKYNNENLRTRLDNANERSLNNSINLGAQKAKTSLQEWKADTYKDMIDKYGSDSLKTAAETVNFRFGWAEGKRPIYETVELEKKK